MKFFKDIFGFFKIPLQIAKGLYFAFVLLVGTVGSSIITLKITTIVRI